eukprot:NODE_519_length_7315_cov_0.500554.p1 type:complete len:399 gc:universal NODE_519_length_7315_cov_0.500554:3403-4599(+)
MAHFYNLEFNICFILIYAYLSSSHHVSIFPKSKPLRTDWVEVLNEKLPTTDPFICSRPVVDRYDYLKQSGLRYFIMINLHNNDRVLPNIASELFKTISTYLGAGNVFISIYESGSRDYSKTELDYWSQFLDLVGIAHRFETGPVVRNTNSMNRIDYLAYIRNKALQSARLHSATYDHMVFINDVYFCKDDLLELIHQRILQNADMVGGLDFDLKSTKSNTKRFGFYDNWVFRDLNGAPPNNFIEQLLKNPESQERLVSNKPVQVMCLWNGMTVMEPGIFQKIEFRRGNNREFGMKEPGECSGSEITTLCSDMIKNGFNKIVLIPDVHLVYKYNDFYKLKYGSDPVTTRYPPYRVRNSKDIVEYQELSNNQLCEPYFDGRRDTGPDLTLNYLEKVKNKI